MPASHAEFRLARRDDAHTLAELVNIAGEGLPLYLWGKLAAPGESAWDVGRQRAAREEGSFSYRNATIVEADGEAAGCLIGYELPDEPEPIPADMPPMFVPLQELENLVPSTWYVNVLAVLPGHRDKGLGTKLLERADEIGRSLGKRGMSVIASDANTGARRLYERCGYRETARREIIKEEWSHAGRQWVLLAKEF
jgi:ribosomal protein S18 acetylase RimI-like enzyme